MLETAVFNSVFYICFFWYSYFQNSDKASLAPLFFVPYLLFYEGGLDNENYRAMVVNGYYSFETLLLLPFSFFPDVLAFKALSIFSVLFYLYTFQAFVRKNVADRVSRAFIYIFNFSMPFGALYAFSSFRQFVALGCALLIMTHYDNFLRLKPRSIFMVSVTVPGMIASHVTAFLILIAKFRQYSVWVVLIICLIGEFLIESFFNFSAYLVLQTSRMNFFGVLGSSIIMGTVILMCKFQLWTLKYYILPLVISSVLAIVDAIPGVLFLRIMVYLFPFLLIAVFGRRLHQAQNALVVSVSYLASFTMVMLIMYVMMDRKEFLLVLQN